MDNPDKRLADISSNAFADEQKCVHQMLAGLETHTINTKEIFARARKLVTRSRKAAPHSGIEAFLHTYGLNTHEGVAVMCLAEALLRIPDTATANHLIEDKISDADWGKYSGQSESFFVNAASWGLLLGGKIVYPAMSEETPSQIFGRIISRMGEPVVREAIKQAMRFIGSQFVLGQTIDEAIKKSIPYAQKGYRFSYDILGEGARTNEQAEYYVKAYRNAIGKIGKLEQGKTLLEAPSISVKLSALHPRYQLVNEKRVMDELLPRLIEIITLAMKAGIGVSIDAEEAPRLDLELTVFKRLFAEPAFANYEGIGFVLQAYQKRAVHVLGFLTDLSRKHKKRMPIRLVKGAYWDTEIKNAQVSGLPSYPVFTRKEHTDVSYMACAQKIIDNMDCFYPQFATHNALTLSYIMEMAGDKKHLLEFQRLYGMGETIHDQLVKDVPCRIYAPIGSHKDLLAYLMRRMLENGANTSFVNLLADKETPEDILLQDPIAKTLENGGLQNERIANPSHLYTGRRNSSGIDLGNATMLQKLAAETTGFRECFWYAKPEGKDKDANITITEPANKNNLVGYVEEATIDAAKEAVSVAQDAFLAWSKTDAAKRAAIIEKYADMLEENKTEALALLMREAGKNISDAISEVREAVDFCNYYAAQARKLLVKEEILQGPTGEQNTVKLMGRGVFVCISPWNFPLAIFTGQIVAALVTGNTVIAKPAESTPLIADFAVKLLHKAGIPKEVLHFLPGRGEVIGEALTSDERIAGVVFTGSMETARHINRTLANRNGPIATFIAETGGQNCMIVDSSALPEQVTDDIIISAFGSAGQRCSALRVLYVQEEIAVPLIELISGAMRELKTGNPFSDFSVDVGPVIDEQARTHLYAHIEQMKKQGRLLAIAPLDAETAASGTYVAPHMFEISSISELKNEVFGPVLHVIRYQAHNLAKICDEINATGYGLTFGLESRIEHNAALIKERIRAGNIYINRSMIGATVGVQPFGGDGLSGTGPKAGGAHYLLRFVSEHTNTVNTAAIGGNLELLTRK